ncbi:hypothetical protein HZS_1188 [Henneguya salminicola]|nr:hypothetical protein HZS_1188 [Henneguya salminicola]
MIFILVCRMRHSPQTGGNLMKDANSNLKTAVFLDREKNYEDALGFYITGLNDLLIQIKKSTSSVLTELLRAKFKTYAQRAEEIKEEIKKAEGEKILNSTVIKIQENEKGWDYEKIFNVCFDTPFESVVVEDPYTSQTHQYINFLRFCELLLHKSTLLKKICLKTKLDESSEYTQKEQIKELQQSLGSYDVILTVEYSKSLHDRTIIFSNGYTVILGRGLDIFKPIRINDKIGKFSIGFYDYKHRECHETSITIFKSSKT